MSSTNYYNSDEYKQKIAEVEEQKLILLEEKIRQAEEKKREQASERRKLLKIFTPERCGQENMHMVKALIDRAAFLRVELTHIEEQIRKEGTLDFFVQGTQTMWREHPLNKVHVQHSKSYREVIKQLESYVKGTGDDSGELRNDLTGLIQRGNAARDKYRK